MSLPAQSAAGADDPNAGPGAPPNAGPDASDAAAAASGRGRSLAAPLAIRLATRRGRVEALLEQLLVQATGGGGADDALYARLRYELLTDPLIGPRIPRYVRMALDLGQFWQWIREQRPSHAGRCELIWTDFGPILDHVARLEAAPARFDATRVYEAWRRALERRTSDPEGAVRAARVLLETVCRHVLDGGAPYPADVGLGGLWRLVAERLELAPRDAAERDPYEPALEQILLGACDAVVEGLGATRRRGMPPVKPAARQAELAVNLAGSVALFLLATAEARGAR